MLAKLVNYAAKKWPATGGVVDLRDEARRARLMAITPVEEVWGIGRRLTTKLESQGSAPWQSWCQQMPRACGGDMSSRRANCSGAAGDPMHQALAGYMERAAEKLRTEGMRYHHVTMFIRTSPFNDKEPYYGNQISAWVAVPTNDTRAQLALIGPHLSNIWRDRHRYQKGGVMLADFTPDSIQQGDLFTSEQQGPRSNALMQVIDKINKEGLGKVYFGARGRDTSEWMM